MDQREISPDVWEVKRSLDPMIYAGNASDVQLVLLRLSHAAQLSLLGWTSRCPLSISGPADPLLQVHGSWPGAH